MILIVKHIDIEGPGTLGDFLDHKKIPYTIIDLGAGDALPSDFSQVKGVVVLGGPMNVDEEHLHSFLKRENEFIKEVLRRQIPFLGICLGSQLLAKAAGAMVVKSPVKEIGWYHVQLTEEGKRDPLFKGFREDEPIYHWHGDMFQVPSEGKLLATAEGCPHQALKVGDNAYGLQFHVEVTDRSIKEWCDEYCENDLPGRPEHAASMKRDYWKYEAKFVAQANRLYENFLEVVMKADHNNSDNLMILKMSFEEWINFLFERPMERNQWDTWGDVPSDYIVESPRVTVEYITRLFNNPQILDRFTDLQVEQGLSYIIWPGLSKHMECLYHPDISDGLRRDCVNSIYFLFKNYFSFHCLNGAYLKETDSVLDSFCYMWWDEFPNGYGPENLAPDGVEKELVGVMERILKLDSLTCKESAIHGLGHWYRDCPKEVERVLNDFLESNPDLDPELKQYALKAKVGDVQ